MKAFSLAETVKSATRMLFCLSIVAGAVPGRSQDYLIATRSVEGLAVQADGQFLVADGQVLRVDKDGSLDAKSLTSIGRWPVLAVANDGTVLGLTSGVTRIKWGPDLQIGRDPLFPETSTRAFLLQPDGKVVLAQETGLLRRNLDGTIDPSFLAEPFASPVPPPIAGPVRLALQEDGKILVAGLPGGLILRYHLDGTLDEGFHAPAIRWVRAMLVQADGKIVIGAWYLAEQTGITGMAGTENGLVRLNADGSLDGGFAPGFEERVDIDSLALQANGKILATGAFIPAEGKARTDLVRLNSDGTVDSDFPAGTFVAPGPGGVPIAIEEDGRILAGVTVGNISNYVVRLANNEAATQSFTREGSNLKWMSGGSTPEVYQARFHASVDGIEWIDLGAGERIEGGWQLEGANVPGGARFRIRGYVTGTSHHLDFVPGAPALYRGPADVTNEVNTEATFRVLAKGREPLKYQWFKDGQAMAGAQSASLVLSGVTSGAEGGYHVVVSNAEGSSTSRVARLTFSEPIAAGNLKLGRPAYDAGDGSVVVFFGASEAMTILQISTDLEQWSNLETNSPGTQSVRLSADRLPAPHTFFRLRQKDSSVFR